MVIFYPVVRHVVIWGLLSTPNYVRPIVEYCSPVWSPTAVGQINKIELVQRWSTKRIKSLSNPTYDERLIKLGNDRLELRHL